MDKPFFNKRGELQTEQKSSEQFLTFWIDSQLYGIAIEQVVQIIGVQKIVPMPQYPDYAKGIVNLRGDIVPVIDVRLRFQMKEAPYTERTCIIICNIDNMHVGFIVDSVDEVATIDANDVAPAPDLASENTDRFVIGIGKPQDKIILLLNANKIIRSDVLKQLSK